jgi:hypothetical protein
MKYGAGYGNAMKKMGGKSGMDSMKRSTGNGKGGGKGGPKRLKPKKGR